MLLYYIFNFLPFALIFIAYLILCKRLANIEKIIEAGIQAIRLILENFVPTEKK